MSPQPVMPPQPAMSPRPLTPHVAVIIPTLNEAESIGRVVAEIPRDRVQSIIVADGGSVDATAEQATRAGARVIAAGRGYGRACLAGAMAAEDAEVLVFMDGDGADDPNAIERLVDPIAAGDQDFVIGSRVRGRAARGSLGAHQRLAGRSLGFAMRLLYGVGYTDMCALRAIRRDVLLKLGMTEMTYGWNLEMQMRAARASLKVLEVPVDNRPRLAGESKVSGSLRGSMRAAGRILTTFGRQALAPTPLMARADHASPSVFRPENMLREARRQKGLPPGQVAPVCILDPDGDIVSHVRQTRNARACTHWACYHTQMWEWEEDGQRFGIVGSAVGASFAVLVAEQLFVCGCELLLSIASAGQIAELGQPPYHILIERALRDEGTSYHYLPAAEYVDIDAGLLEWAGPALGESGLAVHRGDTWTTDAPFRETAEAIAERKRQGVLAVEMEAAALYAFAQAGGWPVLCLAHVTNQLGCVHGDFEKGVANGAHDSLTLVRAVSARWRERQPRRGLATTMVSNGS